MKRSYNPPLTADPHGPLCRVDKAIELAQKRLDATIDAKRHGTNQNLAREVIKDARVAFNKSGTLRVLRIIELAASARNGYRKKGKGVRCIFHGLSFAVPRRHRQFAQARAFGAIRSWGPGKWTRPLFFCHQPQTSQESRSMKSTALLCAVLLTGCSTTGMDPAAVPAAPGIDMATLDQRIEALMRQQDVKGLGIAVIDGKDITHVKTFGYRNVEQRLPLQTDTIMYGASLTKAAFAYMVLQLVDEGKIGLDRPISDYLAKPLPAYDDGDMSWASLEGDEDWRLLTPRILLSHSSGLANLRFFEVDQDLQFHFKPGQGYAYSGEGYYLLQFLLEEGLGLDVKAEMQRRIFDRFGMPDTDMQWREAFAGNLADGYAMDGSFEPHDERSSVSGSGSMDTTVADQARMWRGMLAGEGLSKAMRNEWIRPQVPIRTAYKFPTIVASSTRDPRTEAIDLQAALGVDTWQGPGGPTFAKGGHNDWTGNIVICQQVEDRCVVLMSNSTRAEIVYPEIVRLVLGETNYPWWWTYPELHGKQ